MTRPLSRLAVIVPSWNSVGLLRHCLESLEGQDADIELLVVDNGSEDESVAYLREEGVPHVSLPANVGFAAAINLGVARSSAPAILVLNADTVLEPGCVGSMLEALDADPSLGGVQPRILQLEGEGEGGSPGPVASARIYSAGQALSRDGRAFEEAAGEENSARSTWPVARSSASAAPPACCGGSCSRTSAATTSATSPSTRTSTST